MSKTTNTWISINPKEFIFGDIICNRKTQEFALKNKNKRAKWKKYGFRANGIIRQGR